MKKMILGICYLFLTQYLAAQISGKVTDASLTPIASATVELSNGLSTLTTESGSFEFKKVKPGNYTLQVTSIGYQSANQQVSTGSPIDIKLERLNLFLQPVEIKATRADDKAPFTKSNLSKKEIEKLNLGQDLPFILNQTPSVIVNSDAGNGVGYTGIRIRGSDASRTNVTLNGIPFNDAESQGTFFVNLPDFTSSVNSIQVQRGVGTSSNGASAFGATINLSTNETNTTPYAEINNTYGSFNTWKHTIKAGSGLINDHFTIDARLSKISSDGYIDRASSSLKSFYLSGAYINKNTSIRLNIFSGSEKTYQAWNGIPEGKLKNNDSMLQAHYYNNLGLLYFTPQDSVNLFKSDPRKYNYFTYGNQTDNYQQDHYQLFINHDFNGRWTANTAFHLTRGKGYFEEYKPMRSYADYGLNYPAFGTDTIFSTDAVQQQWLDNYFYGQILSVQYKDNISQLIIGGGWNHYDGKHYGNVIWAAQGGVPSGYRWYNNDADKTDINAYAKYQVKILNNLQAFADLQYRRVKYNIGGFRDNPNLLLNNTWDFVNPKLGLSYSKNNYQLYASYSIGRKEPNRDDFEAGADQQPKPEKMHDVELGAEQKTKNYNWGVTLYSMFYEDQLVLTGKVNDVGNYTRTNVPYSYRMGVELQGGLHFTNWFNVAANLTFSENRIKNFTEYYDNYDSIDGTQKDSAHGNTDIALSPSIVGSGILNFIPVNNLDISLLGKYVSRQYLDNTSNKARSLDAYYVQDARISYTLRKLLFKEITFIGQVNNVFNKKYTPTGYTYSYQSNNKVVTENFYYPMAGTNFMVGLNVKL